ncbi:hypothetical protein QFC21_003116 [Naganishia friedmannii]|uniref:Uncharacterized protein n=1 Tax=Naganishia friedmannii TaxID=89922 RepID=A0ACC2VTL7_9TREE|nr:hypothetical protein QFC21_003116 [Naganishia friedmannii]
MPPFTYSPLISGIKEKVEAVLAVGQRIYVACNGGILQIYELQYAQDAESSAPKAKLIKTKKGIARRQIDQLGYIEDIDTLVVLSDSQITLWDLPNLKAPTILTQLKNVQSFGTHNTLQPSGSLTASAKKKNNPAKKDVEQVASQFSHDEGYRLTEQEDEVLVSTLVVGCRKRVVVMSWSGGKPLGGLRDLVLPHSPRMIIFPSPKSPSISHLHVSPTDFYILRIPSWPSPSTIPLTFAEAPAMTAPSSVVGNVTDSNRTINGGTWAPGSGFSMHSMERSGTPNPAGALTAGTNNATGAVTGAFSGLGGYMGKGFGVLRSGSGSSNSRIVACAVAAPAEELAQKDSSISGEVLTIRDGTGVFLRQDGTLARETGVAWSAIPEDLAFSNPYIFSVLPPASALSASTQSASSSSSTVQIRLSQTLNVQQVIQLPAHPSANSPAAGTTAAFAGSSIKYFCTTQSSTRETAGNATTSSLMTGGPISAVYVSVPNDKLQLQTDGSTIWAIQKEGWRDQLDEMIILGRFTDGLGLVGSLRRIPDSIGKEDLDEYEKRLKTLSALSLFSTQSWEAAFNDFMELDVTPAKVVALFPADQISGRLHVPQDEWVETFGGPPGGRLVPLLDESETISKDKQDGTERRGVLGHMTHLGLKKKPSMDTLADKASMRDGSTHNSGGDEDAGSSDGSVKEFAVYPPAAVENLMIYLSDRRQKLAGAIANLEKPLPTIDSLPAFKTVTTSELVHYPSVPMTELTPEELVRVSQIVYTALIKVYLMIRPSLVGSLCRIENWCEVEEVEELLKERSRFSDLIDLYQGKRMHQKALDLLRQQSVGEVDKLDRLDPTIRYLQKLGPKYLNLIFSESKWLFKDDPRMASRVFIADEPEVEALPRSEVTDYLEQCDKPTCIRYLEHIITELGEGGPNFHDKLAELYLEETRREWPKGSVDPETESYKRLLRFLQDSTQYRPERLLGRSELEDMPRARALLLGRLGNHEAALRIYVNQLESYRDAEDYCTKAYQRQPDPNGVFLALLKIYLSPVEGQSLRLEPALNLIATHGTRVDAQEVLNLLPPRVTMNDVREFFVKTLRDGHAKTNQSKITKQLLKTRKEQVDRGLASLQQKRVRITDIRICPQCHKRIGQSAIAVHAPSGIVTHYQCRKEAR